MTSCWKLDKLESRTLLAVGALTEQIIVDQFGWRADAPRKVVLFADPTAGQNSANRYTPGGTFEVRRTSNDSLAFTGSITSWRNGAVHSQSQDRVWSGDFSALTTPGEYYVYDPARNVRSFTFKLANPVFNDILRASTRTFFYQRSGFDITPQFGGNWHHPASHVGPNQDKAAMPTGGATGPARDLSGGWYDAGDFNRYVPFTTGVMWDLLNAVEWNPGAFSDSTNIPESGNGVPDLLDEVKFETDWLLKMQLADGSVINRVGNLTYDIGGGPNADTQPRYYTRSTTWATASFAASLAHAARVFAAYDWQYPGYADALRAAAGKAWDYLTATPNMFPASGTDGANMAAAPASSDANGDRRLRLLAAAELWKTTGDAKYKAYFEARHENADTSENGQHPLLGAWPHFDASAGMDLNRAFVTYATTPGASATIVGEVKASLKTMVDEQIVPAYNNLDDPYRGYMWDGHYSWGSNQAKSQWANLLTYAIKLNVNPAQNAKYREIAEEYLHYFHGRNPLSQVYLSNTGILGADKSPMQLYHGWFQDGSAMYDGPNSTYGPAPGFLEGGPNQFFTVNWVAPPYGQPIQKAYKDWNTGWNPQRGANENSWEVTENAIYYQAAYTLLLSQFSTDAYAPTAQGRFDRNDAAHALVLQFSEDVGGTLTPADLSVTRLSGAGPTPTIAGVAYDPVTRRARVAFALGARLTDGRYRVTLAANGVADAAGNASGPAAAFDFAFMAGDANGDARVDFDDLLVLAQHYNAPAGKQFGQGDFNYDGAVNFDDLLILAQRYNTALDDLAAPEQTAAAKSLFQTAQPVKKPQAVAKPAVKRAGR